MIRRNYIPQPIDTSDIQLPEELNPLLEAMAKNVHDIWAKERIVQGWTDDEKRDVRNSLPRNLSMLRCGHRQ